MSQLGLITLKTGPVSVNTYILYSKQSGKGLIIDPGGNTSSINAKITESELSVDRILLTHGHFDHAGACAELQKQGMVVYIHADDADKLYTDKNMSACAPWYKFERLKADILLHDNDIVDLDGHKIKVIHTPGHTTGSVCYLIDDVIFSGDTLFRAGVGRSDLDEGVTEQMLIESISSKIYVLQGDYIIYPGHGPSTTLEYEKKYNPYVRL